MENGVRDDLGNKNIFNVLLFLYSTMKNNSAHDPSIFKNHNSMHKQCTWNGKNSVCILITYDL